MGYRFSNIYRELNILGTHFVLSCAVFRWSKIEGEFFFLRLLRVLRFALHTAAMMMLDVLLAVAMTMTS